MRIRALKPGFFKNEDLCELSPWHRLCFSGLWLCADRDGRLEDRPKRLKAEIFPYDDVDVDGLMWDLSDAGFIVRYAVEGVALACLPTWDDHQHPRQDESKSELPAFAKGTQRVRNQTLAQSDTEPSLSSIGPVTDKRFGSGDLEVGIGKLEMGDGTSGETPAASSPKATHVSSAQTLMDLWNATTQPPIPRCRELTSERRQKIKARLAKRPSLSEWKQVFEAIQNNPFCSGRNDRGWVADFDYAVKNDTVAAKALERAATATRVEGRLSPQGELNREVMQRVLDRQKGQVSA